MRLQLSVTPYLICLQAHAAHWGPAIFCTPSCTLSHFPPTLAHTFWQTIQTQLEVLMQYKYLPAKKSDEFSARISSLNCSSQKLLQRHSGSTWPELCEPQSWHGHGHAGPQLHSAQSFITHIYSRQYAILSFLHYFNIWYCSCAYSYPTQSCYLQSAECF